MKGTIVKGIGGFYYVDVGTEVLECKARGLFRKEGITPYVGDRVEVELLEEEPGKGFVQEILPRKNVFIRPPVSNVDCFVTVLAAARPEPNLFILDQFLVMAEEKQAEIIVCFNKVDLAKPKKLEELKATYEPLYPVLFVSGKTGAGVDELQERLKGRKSAFAGPSGAGKSTLLNRILGRNSMETGEVSRKTGRGKHTTRHAELFAVDSSTMLFDTPGFTSFDIMEAEEDELCQLFPEMETLAGQCRYDNCRHLREPECVVTEAVKNGEISIYRYQSYCEMIKMIRERRPY